MQSIKFKQEIAVQTSAVTPSKQAQIVIVGAGLSGLAAAQRLYEVGIRDVIVLEAQDRIGGRVHTINHSNYVLELGAQWLHGAEDNPLYEWLLEKNMLDDFEDASLGFQGLFCTSSGKEIKQSIVEKVLDILVQSKLLLSKNKCFDIVGEEGFKKASEVFRHQLEMEIESDEELLNNKSLVDDLFEWFLRYETIENCCDNMNEVSTHSYTDYTDWGDGTLLNFKHGYKSLLDWFCNQLPSTDWINLNKEVKNIENLKFSSQGLWIDEAGCSHEKPVLVQYVDKQILKKDTFPGSSISSLIECNHVIITSSIGFLKKNHETLFTPKLPENKSEIIRSIGFGTVNKIVLEFERPFWNIDDHGIKLVWKEVDKVKFPSWTQDIIAFDVVRKQPNLLIGWIGGLGAKLMEQESDSAIEQICIQILDQFLPITYSKPTRLVSCICSRWNSNPFICGSYSFQSIKSLDKNVDNLHEPLYDLSSSANMPMSKSTRLSPRILFAGEATAGNLYSTTHGAIISGWREADRLSDHIVNEESVNIQQVNIDNQRTQIYH